MTKVEKKDIARNLRTQGMSIKSISKRLAVSQGSVSVWCRDLRLSDTQREKLVQHQIASGHKGRMMGVESNKRKKANNIYEQKTIAKAMVGKLTKRDKLMLGIGLYWGEGVKAGRSGTALVNSDPSVILFARDWFEQLGVKRSEFNPYIYVSEIHKPREHIILTFWSELLSIPKEQFNKIIFLKGRPKKVYENYDSYYGVLALRVARGTTLRYKIMGLIEASK
jgi:hypothetical protein